MGKRPHYSQTHLGLAHQRNDDLAVRCGLEVIRLLQALSNQTVVVDLAIDGENDGLVGIGKRLGAGLCGIVSDDSPHFEGGFFFLTNANDAQTFKAKD